MIFIRKILRLLDAEAQLVEIVREKTETESLLKAFKISLNALEDDRIKADKELSLIYEKIDNAKMDATEVVAMRHRAMHDARRLADVLSKTVNRERLKRSHRIGQEIIRDAEETASQIMAGAEAYADAVTQLGADEVDKFVRKESE